MTSRQDKIGQISSLDARCQWTSQFLESMGNAAASDSTWDASYSSKLDEVIALLEAQLLYLSNHVKNDPRPSH